MLKDTCNAWNVFKSLEYRQGGLETLWYSWYNIIGIGTVDEVS